jgi:thymidylate synthase
VHIHVTNVHQLLPAALSALREYGERRESRNGPVLVFPDVVTVTYTRPWQRVMFWPTRDCNPALHLYESLWMLRGRNDIEPLRRMAKQFNNYTDDGVTMHGAYGHRWRQHFGIDQLDLIVKRLRKDPTDRRCVLAMWDPTADLDRDGKDLPCNTTATVQLGVDGKLNLSVFNRSNDLVWGLAGANAVQFATLQEYLACRIGCPIGVYNQITVNMHAYLDTLAPLEDISKEGQDPYADLGIMCLTMPDLPDNDIEAVVSRVDRLTVRPITSEWGKMVWAVLHANKIWRESGKEDRFQRAMAVLNTAPFGVDWVVAQREWFERREMRKEVRDEKV